MQQIVYVKIMILHNHQKETHQKLTKSIKQTNKQSHAKWHSVSYLPSFHFRLQEMLSLLWYRRDESGRWIKVQQNPAPRVKLGLPASDVHTLTHTPFIHDALHVEPWYRKCSAWSIQVKWDFFLHSNLQLKYMLIRQLLIQYIEVI